MSVFDACNARRMFFDRPMELSCESQPKYKQVYKVSPMISREIGNLKVCLEEEIGRVI